MPSFPEMPPQLRESFPESFWNWWQSFKSYILSEFFTKGDVTCLTAGKGLVLRNAAGTVRKRIRLNDAGTDFIFEDV